MGNKIFLKFFILLAEYSPISNNGAKHQNFINGYFISVRPRVVKGKEVISFVDILLNFLLILLIKRIFMNGVADFP
jgi:hypothetical protein